MLSAINRGMAVFFRVLDDLMEVPKLLKIRVTEITLGV